LARDSYWLLIPRMAWLQGTANALGFALYGLLGWALAHREIRRPTSSGIGSVPTILPYRLASPAEPLQHS